jgi:hypothetical protein
MYLHVRPVNVDQNEIKRKGEYSCLLGKCAVLYFFFLTLGFASVAFLRWKDDSSFGLILTVLSVLVFLLLNHSLRRLTTAHEEEQDRWSRGLTATEEAQLNGLSI